MEIKLAKTDKEISLCYRVMQELRPEISKDDFLPRIRNQEKSGYKVALAINGISINASKLSSFSKTRGKLKINSFIA